jgi:hypothetical protein
MKVKNVSGTGEKDCPCGSWSNHWGKSSGLQLSTELCSVVNCPNFATVGAHVQLDNPVDNSLYIVPLCDYHNRQFGTWMEIYDNIRPVSAHVSATCGK